MPPGTSGAPPALAAALREATKLAAAAAAAARDGGVLGAGRGGGVVWPTSDTRLDMALLPVLDVGDIAACDDEAWAIVRPNAAWLL